MRKRMEKKKMLIHFDKDNSRWEMEKKDTPTKIKTKWRDKKMRMKTRIKKRKHDKKTRRKMRNLLKMLKIVMI